MLVGRSRMPQQGVVSNHWYYWQFHMDVWSSVWIADCSKFTLKKKCEARFWTNDTNAVCLWSTNGCVEADMNWICPYFNISSDMCTGAIARGADCFWCSSFSKCQPKDEAKCEMCEKKETKVLSLKANFFFFFSFSFFFFVVVFVVFISYSSGFV